MDIYLLQHCSFYVGTSSGITDTAFLLEKPVVLTNICHWINLMPPRQNDLIIFKKVYSKTLMRTLTIQEWLERTEEITPAHYSSPDWEFIENTEVELNDVINEMLYKIKPENEADAFELQTNFKTKHRDAFLRLTTNKNFSNEELENINNWYRFGSRIVTWQGKIGSKFLKENWEYAKV
jgi:putative glycosyltransferase (TIGR04372 family)